MLRLENIQFAYDDLEFEFNFELATGQCLAVMGESGSGKTTLLNLIAGFLNADSGQIYFNDQRIDNLKPHQRPLTILFQEHNLFNHLTAFQNIGLGINPSLKLNDFQKQSVSDALNEVNLAGMQDRLPESLSGGQRQRVALARCLVRSKPLLLLDEPFGGLNEDLKIKLTRLLAELKHKRELTIIWITHDKDDVKDIADQQMQIKHGKINSFTNA